MTVSWTFDTSYSYCKVKSVPENFRQAYHWGTGDHETISTAAMERFYQLTESD